MITKAASMTVAAGIGTVAAAAVVFQIITSTGLASAANAPAPGQAKRPSPSPEAAPPPKELQLSVDPMAVSGLFPGGTQSRTLTVWNSNNQDLLLQSISTVITDPAPAGGCTSPTDVSVTLADWRTSSGAAPTIKKNSKAEVPVTVRMNETGQNQDACEGKTFTFTFTATATSK